MGFICKCKFYFLILILLLSFSCMGGKKYIKKTFIRENVDISYIKKVAVLTFENHTKEENAGEIVRDIVTTEILAMKLFDTVGKSIVNAVLTDEVGQEVSESGFDKDLIKRICKNLKVDGVIIGSVDAYGEKRDGMYSYPVITLTLRLLDSKNGIILWQTSGTETGYSLKERLFGIKAKDIDELSFELVERMLSTFR